MNEHFINKLNNFIMGWYIDPSICDEIVQYHIDYKNKWDGQYADGKVDKKEKDSIDCTLDDTKLYEKYAFGALQKCTDNYSEKYQWNKYLNRWTISEKILIQQYKIGGGYYKWHTERCASVYPANNRHLVFMTYLNDVSDGGETEFFHQNIKIKPEKGLTIIWPSDWTFMHRGIPSMTEEKYIITGWYSFV